MKISLAGFCARWVANGCSTYFSLIVLLRKLKKAFLEIFQNQEVSVQIFSYLAFPFIPRLNTMRKSVVKSEISFKTHVNNSVKLEINFSH